MSTATVTPASVPQMISAKRLHQRLGVSPATLWRMVQRGDIPAPFRLSPGRVAWSEDVIREWLISRMGAAR